MNSVGRYEIIEKLGQGGMGTVYKAFDPLLTRVVAVKVIAGQLDGSPEHRERFFREARAAAQLSHSNIITIYDLGEQDGSPYLAMEYLEGRDLDQRLHDPEGMSLTRKLELALSICEGLAHAHLCGLIHRDIKPANVFVTDDGVVKILDFGLARLITSELTRTNAVVGTVNYMAPEQLRGERADHRADIFSFGVLLYELFGGRKPFQGDSAASTMYKILHETPQALDELDPAIGPPLTTTVDRAMAKAREDRYQRMTDVLRDLEAAYEPMRGADRRVISRVEEALRPPTGSKASVRPVGFDPDNATTLSDETVPMGTPRPRTATAAPGSAPAAPVAATPPPVAPARRLPGRLAGALAVAVLAVAGWFIAGSQAPAPVVQAPPAGVAVSPEPQPAPPLPPPTTGPAATDAPVAPPSSDTPTAAAPAAPRNAPTTREPRSAATAREAELSLERTRATAALALMDAGKAAAQSANARELAPQIFAAAEKEEAAAREDYRQQRFAAAAGRMEATATLFRSAVTAADAETEARAARTRLAEEGRRRAEQAARQLPPPPAPVANPPAAPRPEPAPPPAPVQPTPQEAVMTTLRRYTSALEQRDVNALKAVWPGLSRSQQAAVEAEFANARSIDVELANPRIDLVGQTATVSAVRHYRLNTRDGQQLRSDTSTTLTLRQAAGGWVIESVSHRPLR